MKSGVLLVVAQLTLFVSARDCLSEVPFDDLDKSAPRLPNGTQAIVTSYKFRCCGHIAEWKTYVEPGGGKHQGVYDISFQVWRPSPTVQESGCYSRVGENRFTSISPDQGLVSKTPEPSNILTVQPGDVVGFYILSRRGMDDGIQMDATQNTESVWYDTNIVNSGTSYCRLPVGTRSLRFSTNVAPVLSVSVSSFTCPPTPAPLSSSSSFPSASSSGSPSTSSSGSPSSSSLLPPSMISITTSVLSNSLTQPVPSPTSLPSGPSDTPSQSTSMSQPPTKPTSAIHFAIMASVLVVVISMVSVLVVLVVVLLYWRRKKNTELQVTGSVVDLSNPNYDSGFMSSLLKEQSSNKQQMSSLLKEQSSNKQQSLPVKTPYMPLPVPLGGPDMTTTMYGNMGTEVPEDYIYPTSSHGTLAGSPYAYIPVPPGRAEEGQSAETTFTSDGGMLYHAVGPRVKEYVTDEISNRSTSLPPPPPVPTKNSGTGQESLYHILEESLEDQSLQYEDPTLLKFRQDSAKPKGMFESTGYYVPTAEQRKMFRLNYEQQHMRMSVGYDKLNFFAEEQVYWAPACTTSGLYSQLASKRYREITRDQIRIMEKLGSGQFGEVCRALWTVDEHTLELAVKTLKPGTSEEDKVKFLQEAAINGQFSHSNVIKMYGIVTLGEPVLICLEILANGDLRSYLQGLQLSGSKHRDFMEAQIMFLKFAKEIAAGMDYLSKKSFVHRDLAARNILLDKSLICKVADFGMARDLVDDTYYTSSGGKIPLKWTAPEALLYKKYSADSDVWSYGMVLFEIWSVAKKPFATVSNNEVLGLIQKRFCQAPPPGCPRAIYELMVDCWNPDHTSRPSFSKICSSYLKHSSAKILYWAPEDETLSPAVGVCGAPLEEAYKLHLDLQKKYKNLEV